MPVMDGYTATRKIREWELENRGQKTENRKQKMEDRKEGSVLGPQSSALAIIAMTAHAMAGDAEKSIAAGMSDHVTKPIDPDQLFATLQKWIQPEKTRGDVNQHAKPAATGSPTEKVSEAEGLPESLSGFDLQDGLNRLQGNEKLYRKLLLDFGVKYADTADKIRQTLDASDFEQAHSLVHNLKGLAGNLAATDLQAAAVEMEKQVKGGLKKEFSKEKLNQTFGELAKTLRATLTSVRVLGPSGTEKSAKPPAAALAEIPPELAKEAAGRIREAAEIGDVIRIKTIAEEFRSKSGAFAPIADRIIQKAADFDFDGVLRIADDLDE